MTPTDPTPKRIAYQGEPGAFSERAARKLGGADAQLVPCRDFPAIFNAVESGEADGCVAPIENTLVGSIHQNYDMMLTRNLTITGEIYLHIVHCLIAPRGVLLENLRRVYSHPAALAQCTNFFREHRWLEPVAAADTAGSVLLVLGAGRGDAAALAGPLAADVYGAEILQSGIEDDPQNFTRFLLLEREPPAELHADKTSIVFTAANQPGILHKVLGAFAGRGIDLSRIESRPMIGRPWDYHFYIDFLAGRDEPGCKAALDELRPLTTSLRILGSYPRARFETPA
jgi:prephenate dehydratase